MSTLDWINKCKELEERNAEADRVSAKAIMQLGETISKLENERDLLKVEVLALQKERYEWSVMAYSKINEHIDTVVNLTRTIKALEIKIQELETHT